MKIYDIIQHKAEKLPLSQEEIDFFMDGLCRGDIADYQVSALLMAIYLNGMTCEELAQWTLSMTNSGDVVDLSAIDGVTVDKHSTGGIGDKITLVVGPIVAACGGKLAKMSGRGLGFSGGTIDKLEAFPQFNTSLEEAEFIDLVNRNGMAVTGQTANVAPADKKLYALRDVTATVNSIELIASSIMSKKLASGSDKILLDVKIGSGAFMKTLHQGEKLAKAMVDIGCANGRETVAILTNMNIPLGKCVGNLLEIQESYHTLGGTGPEELMELCIWLSAKMLEMGEIGTFSQCETMAKQSIANGSAQAKFREFVEAQGGDLRVLEHPELFYPTPKSLDIQAETDGYFTVVSAELIGKASVSLGAGRLKKGDEIDMTAGIVMAIKNGQYVKKGNLLYQLYAQSETKLGEGSKIMQGAVTLCPAAPQPEKLILKVIDKTSLMDEEPV